MESFSEILNYIGRTNLFNFVIFLSIIIFLCIKLDAKGKLEGAKNGVIENIENSKSAKAESETVLKEVEASVAHLEEEIDEIIRKSEESAHLVGDKILADAKVAAGLIKDNYRKTAEGRAKLLKNDILRRTSNASVEIAKNHIINELRNNPDLHYKLIDESLKALNEVVS